MGTLSNKETEAIAQAIAGELTKNLPRIFAGGMFGKRILFDDYREQGLKRKDLDDSSTRFSNAIEEINNSNKTVTKGLRWLFKPIADFKTAQPAVHQAPTAQQILEQPSEVKDNQTDDLQEKKHKSIRIKALKDSSVNQTSITKNVANLVKATNVLVNNSTKIKKGVKTIVRSLDGNTLVTGRSDNDQRTAPIGAGLLGGAVKLPLVLGSKILGSAVGAATTTLAMGVAKGVVKAGLGIGGKAFSTVGNAISKTGEAAGGVGRKILTTVGKSPSQPIRTIPNTELTVKAASKELGNNIKSSSSILGDKPLVKQSANKVLTSKPLAFVKEIGEKAISADYTKYTRGLGTLANGIKALGSFGMRMSAIGAVVGMATTAVGSVVDNVTKYQHSAADLEQQLVSGLISNQQYLKLREQQIAFGFKEVAVDTLSAIPNSIVSMVQGIGEMVGIIDPETSKSIEQFKKSVRGFIDSVANFGLKWLRGDEEQEGFETVEQYEQYVEKTKKLKQKIELSKKKQQQLALMAAKNPDDETMEEAGEQIRALQKQIEVDAAKYDKDLKRIKDSAFYNGDADTKIEDIRQTTNPTVVPNKTNQIHVEQNKEKARSNTQINTANSSSVQVNNSKTTVESRGVSVLNRNGPQDWNARYGNNF